MNEIPKVIISTLLFVINLIIIAFKTLIYIHIQLETRMAMTVYHLISYSNLFILSSLFDYDKWKNYN